MTIHEAAAKGFAGAAAQYARGRPDYPAQLSDWLQRELGLGAGQTLLDLGAGTGKFSRLLRETGAAVIAVEPIDAMREQLAQRLPDVQLLAGSAEAIPLPDASVDSVFCAQAFHWFANRQALAEIHRVLRPGGQLAMVWNVRDEAIDWVAAISALITPYESDAPRFHTGRWRLPFADQAWFGAPQLSTLPHQHLGPFETVVVDRMLSVSFIASLPEAELAQLEADLRGLADQYPALREPLIAFPYRTEIWLSHRLGTALAPMKPA